VVPGIVEPVLNAKGLVTAICVFNYKYQKHGKRQNNYFL